ncbi:MAG: efflux RND transporter periplasmic adaptor subunit [Methylococcaceae bacterium]|jgi:membrane fusion protein (multidrug efflux system)
MKTNSCLAMAIFMFCLALQNTALSADEPEFVTDVAVQIGQVTRKTLRRYVMSFGRVEPQAAINGQPPASSKIAAPLMGILNQVYCEEGQRVVKGARLFELDTRSADALIEKAKVAVEFAQKNFARKQALNAADNIARKLYDDADQLLQAARKDLSNAQIQRELLVIKAPLTGTVAAIHFKPGEAIGVNAVLADLINLDRLDLALKVSSQEALALRVGQPVDIYTESNAQRAASSNVAFISPQIDPLSDTVLLRVPLSPSASIRPGQFISARIVVEERQQRLAVPVNSVVTNGDISLIALVEGNQAKQKRVKLGLRDGDFVEIEGEGIKEGITLVTEGVYGLPPATRIQVVK